MNVRFEPDGIQIQVKPGTTIMQAASKAGVAIRSRCGGRASCLMCKVEVQSNLAVYPKTDKERRKMGEDRRRLSCQTRIREHVVVIVPEDPLQAVIRKQLQAGREEGI